MAALRKLLRLGVVAGTAVVATALVLSPGGRGVEEARCPDVAARPFAPAGSVRSDVDGDGARDHLWIGRARANSAECRWFVFAQTRVGRRSAVLRQAGSEVYWPTGYLPRLGPLTNLDGHPGKETFVAVDVGASTTAYGVFAVRRHRPMRFSGPPGEFPDAFFEGGSGHGFWAFGCLRSRLLVQGAAWQSGSRFSGRRDFYRLSGTTFRYTASRSFRNVSYATLRRYPEMSAHKFARCTS